MLDITYQPPNILVFALLVFTLWGCQDSGVTTSNVDPKAEITSHADEAYIVGWTVETFRGSVTDPDDANEDLLAIWYVGKEEACAAAAPEPDGTTTCDLVVDAEDTEIILQVRDPKGAVGSDMLPVTVESVVSRAWTEEDITSLQFLGIYLVANYGGLELHGSTVVVEDPESSNVAFVIRIEAQSVPDGGVGTFAEMGIAYHNNEEWVLGHKWEPRTGGPVDTSPHRCSIEPRLPAASDFSDRTRNYLAAAYQTEKLDEYWEQSRKSRATAIAEGERRLTVSKADQRLAIQKGKLALKEAYRTGQAPDPRWFGEQAISKYLSNESYVRPFGWITVEACNRPPKHQVRKNMCSFDAGRIRKCEEISRRWRLNASSKRSCESKGGMEDQALYARERLRCQEVKAFVEEYFDVYQSCRAILSACT